MQRFLKTIGLVSVSTAVMLLGTGASAHAVLLGDSVNGQFRRTGRGLLLDQTANVVDPGVEFTFASRIALDVKDDAFDIIFNIGGGLNDIGAPTTWNLSDLNRADSPSVTVTGLSLVSGDANQVSSTSFTDDSVTVNFVDIQAPLESQTFSFDIQTSDAAAIPTPALLPGLIGFGMSIVRKKRQQEVVA